MPTNSDTTIILGADGFLGRNFVRFFRERGLPYHAIGRDAGDLSIAENADKAFKDAPEAGRILHLVTRQRTGQVQFGIQGELIAINSRIHLNVLESWRQFQPGAKLISTGSSCAYSEFDRPILETDFQAGPMHESVRGYGLAKQLLAVGSDAYAAQYDLKYLHLFLATVYGPEDHKALDRTHFMTGMIDRAVNEKRAGKTEFTVWGDPDTVRDLLYVDDQMEAILAADSAFENERINCSSNAPVTIDACAHAIRDALKWDAEIVYPADTFKGTNYKTLDAAKFLQATNWEPQVALIEGVGRVLSTEYNS